jgi:carbon monoxide dehydrogenase subunit G
MLKTLGIVALLLVGALLALIATRPDTFHVERSAELVAPPDKVFALIDDLHQWPRWSPWEKLDPNMQKTYAGPPSGVGASYSWKGNSDVGAGRLTIVESKPAELVRVKLEFFAPFPGTSEARFELAPSGSGTKVRWSTDGENGFAAKAISLVIDMDKMMGDFFEQGLADLDSAARLAGPGAGTARRHPLFAHCVRCALRLRLPD